MCFPCFPYFLCSLLLDAKENVTTNVKLALMNAAKAQQDVKRHLPNAKRRVLQQTELALRHVLISTKLVKKRAYLNALHLQDNNLKNRGFS
jgi:hypothetical protein